MYIYINNSRCAFAESNKTISLWGYQLAFKAKKRDHSKKKNIKSIKYKRKQSMVDYNNKVNKFVSASTG